MIKAIYIFIATALLAALVGIVLVNRTGSPENQTPLVPEPVAVMCTADAMQCADGSYVGRTGPDCTFICPVGTEADETGLAELIVLESPQPQSVITSPLKLTGQARGSWFFEASFPVSLTNWDGLIIAEGPATAVGDWMTSEFVPFTLDLQFTNPYKTGDPDFMKSGTLILKKDNPSGLPEHDAALEIPVRFAP